MENGGRRDSGFAQTRAGVGVRTHIIQAYQRDVVAVMNDNVSQGRIKIGYCITLRSVRAVNESKYPRMYRISSRVSVLVA